MNTVWVCERVPAPRSGAVRAVFAEESFALAWLEEEYQTALVRAQVRNEEEEFIFKATRGAYLKHLHRVGPLCYAPGEASSFSDEHASWSVRPMPVLTPLPAEPRMNGSVEGEEALAVQEEAGFASA